MLWTCGILEICLITALYVALRMLSVGDCRTKIFILPSHRCKIPYTHADVFIPAGIRTAGYESVGPVLPKHPSPKLPPVASGYVCCHLCVNQILH